MIFYLYLGYHQTTAGLQQGSHTMFTPLSHTMLAPLIIIYRFGSILACEGEGGICKIFCFFFYLIRPKGCSYNWLGLIYLLVICKSQTVFWATKDLLRSLEILCCLRTHLVCFGNREGHLLGLLFQTIYYY